MFAKLSVFITQLIVKFIRIEKCVQHRLIKTLIFTNICISVFKKLMVTAW